MENPSESQPTPPADPRHHRFAILVLKFRYYADAYQEAGFNCSRATAYVNGHRLSRRPDVASYISTMQRLEYEERRRARDSVDAAESQANFRAMIAKMRR